MFPKWCPWEDDKEWNQSQMKVHVWSYLGAKMFYPEKQSGNNIMHSFNILDRYDDASFQKQSSIYIFIFSF